MSNFLFKIKRNFNSLAKNSKTNLSFSLYYALLCFLTDFFNSIRIKKISRFFKRKKDKWILKYLYKLTSKLNKDFKNDNNKGTYIPNQPIWICWWTGEEDAPLLVKKCIDSIKKNAGAHPVNFIDQTTYSNFVEIPEYMLSKVKSGKMKLAHLCDYIRVSLIDKYGGLWLDTTIFCSDTIPESYFDLPFFTCRSQRRKCTYISEMRWTTFVLGGWKNNVFYRYLKAAFEEYWKNNEYAIDYLFFDYLIEIATREIPSINELIENTPVNNLHRDDLQAAMNAALPSHAFHTTINNQTVLYKLSWRETYSLKTEQGEESIYSYFLNYNFDK